MSAQTALDGSDAPDKRPRKPKAPKTDYNYAGQKGTFCDCLDCDAHPKHGDPRKLAKQRSLCVCPECSIHRKGTKAIERKQSRI